MTCKDCYHYEACLTFEYKKAFFYQRQCIKPTITCEHFKEKPKIIELPCKVGSEGRHITKKKQELLDNSDFDMDDIVKMYF